MIVLDRLVAAIRSAAVCNRDYQAAPFCILWPDREAKWAAVLPVLMQAMPELLSYGNYAPEKRTGPAIWLRCAIAGTLSDLTLPEGRTPVLYLPGIGRQDLRLVENCPRLLQPLIPLQFLGTFWSQGNARDWTPRAFLQSDKGGLGLDLATDRESLAAMQLALECLLEEDLAHLEGRRLDRDYFNTLVAGGDPVRDILRWMNDPDAFRQSRAGNVWQAFAGICASRLSFSPEDDGVLSACALLASHEGSWKDVWDRFCEAPDLYPDIPRKIRTCRPPRLSLLRMLPGPLTEGWPQWNDGQEDELRTALCALAELAEHEAKARLRTLEAQHGPRRSLVWAKLGEAPLALALEHLAWIAGESRPGLNAGSLSDITQQYEEQGWQMDDHALKALAAVTASQDYEAVKAALSAVYKPWLEEAARYLQRVCAHEGYPAGSCQDMPRPSFAPGVCLLFVDGLRYDLARRLAADLEADGCTVAHTSVWTTLPSVTASGKPMVTPVPELFYGQTVSADFAPVLSETGHALSGRQALARVLEDAGWSVLEGTECGDGQGRAWCEAGNIDHDGHDRGARLARQIAGLVNEVKERIEDLLDAGWKRIQVVTDHGWLLLPDGLPRSDLPAVLTENRWGRCAVLKDGAVCQERTFPWFWNPEQSVVLADGISCFKKGLEYAHGGLSFQECLTLQLAVSRTGGQESEPVQITDISWHGLRCRVAADGPCAGLMLDLRSSPADPASSLAMGAKPVREDGKASVVVEDDQREGQEAWLVLVTASGQPVAQEKVCIGRNQ